MMAVAMAALTAMVGSGRDDYGFVETYGVGNGDGNDSDGTGNDQQWQRQQ